jgi:CRISPR-associated protein Cas1
MTNRIIDITEAGFYLHIENELLVLEKRDENSPPETVPLDDLAAIIVSNRQTIISETALSAMAQHKAFLVICDERSMPVSLMLPLIGHTLQAERFIKQVSAPKPVQKKLWQQIVCAKIKAQADLLYLLYKNDFGLKHLTAQVKSGDSSNVEAQAAQKYWRSLFGYLNFYRQPQIGEPPNNLLDYGYAVLRAITARAIVGSGLNATFGIHHHHRSNAFCLADDLMEPFRAVVDRAVYSIVEEEGENVPLNKNVKQKLIAPLLEGFNLDGETRTLFDVLTRLTSSLVDVYAGEREDLLLPSKVIT